MQRRKPKKRKKENQFVKGIMVLVVVLVFYILFIWDKGTTPPKEEKKAVKSPENLIEAIYKAPKFEIKGKKKQKEAETPSEKKETKKKSAFSKKNSQDAEKKEEANKQDTGKKEVLHKVMPGDSLWKLSKKYYGTGLKGDLIYKANKNKIRNKNILPVGKTLVIPNVAYHKASKIKEKKKILKDKREKTSSPKKVATKFKKFKLYKVQEDDSLSTISEDFYGTSRKWVYIWKANRRRLKNPNALVVGMVLRIPMDIK